MTQLMKEENYLRLQILLLDANQEIDNTDEDNLKVLEEYAGKLIDNNRSHLNALLDKIMKD